MGAHRAHFGGLLAHHDVAAVAALPDHVSILGEHQAALHVGKQFAVAFLMLLFDGPNALEQLGDVFKALFPGFLGKAGVHIRPFIVFALRRRQQVFRRGADAAQELEPDFGVFLFVVRRFQKQAGNLLIAVLLGLGGKIGILVPGLALPRERVAQVLFGFAAFQFHGDSSFSSPLSPGGRRIHVSFDGQARFPF